MAGRSGFAMSRMDEFSLIVLIHRQAFKHAFWNEWCFEDPAHASLHPPVLTQHCLPSHHSCAGPDKYGPVVIKPVTDLAREFHRRPLFMIPINVPCEPCQSPHMLGPDGVNGRLDLCEVNLGTARVASD